MKALTLTEPWASLMKLGEKNFETRSWSTKYRGLIAIHSAKGMNADAKAFLHHPEVIAAWFRHELQPPSMLGYILCVRELLDVIPTDYVRDHIILPVKERTFGDYSIGRFAWIFSDKIHVFHPPIKAPEGFHLGLWNWMDHTCGEKEVFNPQSAVDNSKSS